MNQERKRRILYLDDFSVDDEMYKTVVEGVEVFASYSKDGAKRLYHENKPYDLIGLHLSTKMGFEFFKFVRGRGREVLIFITSAMKTGTKHVKKYLDEICPSYDGIVWKDHMLEPLGRTLIGLVRKLNNIDKVKRSLENA